MRPEQRAYWEREISLRREQWQTPNDLLHRRARSEDMLDCGIIAGISISDIVAGKIAESQIPAEVIQAFHTQYPQYGESFVDAVRHLALHADRLEGLINGVKGKLFELDYVNWLNHGHLPTGWTADLAHSATNPNWDVAVRDAHGRIHELIQAKATAHLGTIRETIAANPHLDVVVPHDVYAEAAMHSGHWGSLIDGPGTLRDLNQTMGDAAANADQMADFPILGVAIAIGLIGGQNYLDFRRGKKSLRDAFQNTGTRSGLAIVASTGGWAAFVLTGNPLAKPTVSVLIRKFGGQALQNRERRELMRSYIRQVQESRLLLERQLSRPVFEA